MDKIKKPIKKFYDDRIETINKEGKVLKIKPIPLNVQKFKKHVKKTGDLGV